MPVVNEVLLKPSEIEALKSSPLAFPVAVKIESPDIPHKTEAGAVRLGIQNLADLKQAARDVVAAARRAQAATRASKACWCRKWPRASRSSSAR